jgi:fructose transport system substrate-binding protein
MTISRTRRAATLITALCVPALALTACGSDSSAADGNDTLHVTLITKDPNDPFWVAMINGAQKAGDDLGVDITVASGRDQTDADSQVRAIEDAVTRGDDGILIANNGPAVNNAIQKAQDAGVFVIALDTPTTPTDLVAATFASDNREAGTLIGQWATGALKGAPARVAALDLFSDKVVSIDYERDQGFLAGMGIDVGDPDKIGDEPESGTYDGGDFQVSCHEATDGAEDGGRAAMEKCLSIDPTINVVYAANEPAALGAVQALHAAGNDDALVVSINGSCDGVGAVASGQFGAVAQQYPDQMGAKGVQAVVDHVRNGSDPTPDAGLDFINTGIELVTDQPVDGLDSITSEKGLQRCY